jgi:hypothetical protein
MFRSCQLLTPSYGTLTTPSAKCISSKSGRLRFSLCLNFTLCMLSALSLMGQDAYIPQVDNGIHPYGTYDGLHENVSLMSGNMSFCIPILSLPGVLNRSLSIPLCYNSQYIELENYGTQSNVPVTALSYFPWVWGPNTPHLGPGWTLTARPVTYIGPGGSSVLFMPDGARYPITNNPYDTGYIQGSNDIEYGNGYIYQRDGSKNTYFYGGRENDVNSTEAYDRDGYLTTFTANSVVDTVGRTINVSAKDPTNTSPAQLSFQYPDSSGSMHSVIVQFATGTYSCTQGSGQIYGASGTWSMPSAILLPNGTSYTFQYDSCGLLNKVTYPSGGYTRYVYSPQNSPQVEYQSNGSYALGNFTTDELTAKYVCSKPSLGLGATSTGPGNTCPTAESLTTYSAQTSTAVQQNVAMTVTDPAQNTVAYQFGNGVIGPGNGPPMEVLRQYRDSSGNLLKTVQTTYNSNSAGGSGITSPILPLAQTTTLNNGLVSQVQWTHQFQEVSKHDSPLIEQREYDYGQGGPGPLLRRTTYNWWELDNTASFGGAGSSNLNPLCHILDHKTKESVYDVNSNLIAQISYEYDHGDTPGTSSLGDLTKVSRWRNTDGAVLSTSYGWTGTGIYSITDPLGNTTSYDYTDNYADGVNRNSYAFPTTITHPKVNGVSQMEHHSYYWGSGLPAATCGSNFVGTCEPGLSNVADYTSYFYDSMGRQISQISGDGGKIINCFTDDPAGNCYSSSFPLVVSTSSYSDPWTATVAHRWLPIRVVRTDRM